MDRMRDATRSVCADLLTPHEQDHEIKKWHEGLGALFQSAVDARAALVKKIVHDPGNEDLRTKIHDLSVEIRQELRTHKSGFWTKIADKINTAHLKSDQGTMYRLMKESYSGKSKPRGDGDQGYEKGVFKADGATLTANATETRARWFEYTKELFNTPVSLTPYRQLRIDHEGECVDGEIIPMEDLLPPPRPTGPLHSYDSAFTTREQTDARKMLEVIRESDGLSIQLQIHVNNFGIL